MSHELLIIGTGITGLCAAKQAMQSGLSTAMMEAQFFGGLVLNINQLDGEIRGSGSDLATDLMTEVCDMGAENITATAAVIGRDSDGLVLQSDGGNHRARAILIASGAKLKYLGIPGEVALEGKGVSRCADCDGPFYKNQDVVVVGGGDSALQEAMVLAEFARQVHLVHRGSRFSARRHLVDRLAGHANILIRWRTRVEAVLGEQSVQAVRVLGLDNEDVGEIPCTGFFAYVGLEPACEFVPDTVLRDAGGFLLTDSALQTAMAGVFAAGAVRSGYGGLLSHAVAEGVAAANSASASIRD